MRPRLLVRPPLLPLLLLVLLGACSPGTRGIGSPAALGSPPLATASSAASVAASVYPLSLTDDAGTAVTVEADPARIVSLAPSNTEIVCALGSCDQLVGVTDFDDYPPEVADVEHVVVNAQPDVEKIVAADPDLVLAAGNGFTPDEVVAQLRDLGLPVLVLYPESLDEIYADVGLVGAALDVRDAAAALVDGMRGDVAAITEALRGAERPRVFYEVDVYEQTIYTAGEDSFLASLIALAGGDPITGDAATTVIQAEDLVQADPQVILLGDAPYHPELAADPAAVGERPGWSAMSAVRDGRIVPIADDVVVTRPGPRIAEGLKALARAIHPELFDEAP